MIIPYTDAEKANKENLVSDTKSILNWFRLNSLKVNPGKFQFMILGISLITSTY